MNEPYTGDFEPLLDRLRRLWPDLAFGRPRWVYGLPYFGLDRYRPRPTRTWAAPLTASAQEHWVPVPFQPGDPATGEAPVFRVRGRRRVLPVVRVGFRPPDGRVEYLTATDWLVDGFARWRLPDFTPDRERSAAGSPTGGGTVLERLEGVPAADGLRVVARMIWFLLFGRSDLRVRAGLIRRETGLRLPRLPEFLRPGAGNPVARADARRAVVAAVSRNGEYPVPIRYPGDDRRIDPRRSVDRGVDPVHTSQSCPRATGYLGLGVGVLDRRLVAPGVGPARSAATAGVPYAGYDEPRRLQMAAVMQGQAVEVAGREPPVVRARGCGSRARPAGGEPAGRVHGVKGVQPRGRVGGVGVGRSPTLAGRAHDVPAPHRCARVPPRGRRPPRPAGRRQRPAPAAVGIARAADRRRTPAGERLPRGGHL